jgi:hypothetical protein
MVSMLLVSSKIHHAAIEARKQANGSTGNTAIARIRCASRLAQTFKIT